MRKSQEKTNRSGIELAPPSLIVQRPHKAEELAFQAILVLLGLCGASWSFAAVFEIPLLPVTLALYTLLFAALFFAVFQFSRYRGVLLLLLACLFGAAGYVLRVPIVQGFLITTNRIMITYANHSEYVFPIYKVTAAPSSYPLYCTVFAMFMLAFLSMVLCWAVIRLQSAVVVIAATLPFPLSALVFFITPPLPAVLMLFTCWASLLFIHMIGGIQQGIAKKRRAYRAKNPFAAAKGGLHLLPALALSFLLILTVFPMQSYQYSGKAMELRNRIMNTSFDFSLLDSGTTLAGSSDHVSLRGADSIRFSGKTMLEVSPTDPKDSYRFTGYLKGFAGATYTGTSWEPLSDADYAQVSGKLNGINILNLSGDLFSLADVGADSGLVPFGIRVKNVGANKRCIYTPYNLTTKPDQISGVNFVRDETIRSGWLFGTGQYSLYANRLKQAGSFLGDVSPQVLPAALANHIKVSDGEDKNEVLQQILRYANQSGLRFSYHSSVQNFSDTFRAQYTALQPEYTTSHMDDSANDYLTAEQNYRLFLYDKYTALPADLKQKLTALITESNMLNLYRPEGYPATDTLAACVRNYLSSTCTYSLTPGLVPKGKDFTEYFLTENKQGYCVHFATAATLLLRAMGVPARYAEGYIVTSDDYKDSAGGAVASVKDVHAHAWVEIYKVGFGWQPFEMTPGFDPTQNAGQNQNAEETSSSSAPAGSTSSTASSAVSESNPDEKNRSSSSAPDKTPENTEDARTVWTPVLMILACALLFVVILLARRRIALSRRAARFTQPDRNRAAVAIYGYLQKLERFGAEISEHTLETAQKARFSQHSVSPEELNAMREEAEQTVAAVWSRASKTTRFAIRYLFNLN